MRLSVFVQNHHLRTADPIVDAIRMAGEPASVVTDTTNHYRERGHRRKRGNLFNYLRILRTGLASGADWIVTLQDDVSVPRRLFSNIRHILARVPPEAGMVSCYVPQNNLYDKALAGGYRVVESYHNFAILCLALSRPELTTLVPWLDRHVVQAWERNGDGAADDDALEVYCCHKRRPVRTILPSLVQHQAAGDSIFKTPARVAGRLRESGCYAPDFDATTVNWALAFGSALADRSRFGPADRRVRRMHDLTW
jgi:hypothetical protein